MKVKVNVTAITGTLRHKYHGVHLDQALNFEIHFDKFKKGYRKIKSTSTHQELPRLCKCRKDLSHHGNACVYML